MNNANGNKIHFIRLIIGLISALASGFLDGFSYIFKGNFGLIQTGNLVNSIFYLINGEFYTFLTTFCTIITFCIGIYLAYFLEYKLKDKKINVQNLELLLIIILLIINISIPTTFYFDESVKLNRWIGTNILSNCIFAFSGALIFRTFIEFDGNPYVTTMMTANMARLVTAAFNKSIKKENGEGKKALSYLGVIISFSIGIALIYVYYKYSFVPNFNNDLPSNYIANLLLIVPIVLFLICFVLRIYLDKIENKNIAL